MNLSLAIHHGNVQPSDVSFDELITLAHARDIDFHPHVITENWEPAQQRPLQPFEVSSYRPSTWVSPWEIDRFITRERRRHLTPREMMLFLIACGEQAINGGDDEVIAMGYTWFDVEQKPGHLRCFRHLGKRLYVSARAAGGEARYDTSTLILTTDL